MIWPTWKPVSQLTECASKKPIIYIMRQRMTGGRGIGSLRGGCCGALPSRLKCKTGLAILAIPARAEYGQWAGLLIAQEATAAIARGDMAKRSEFLEFYEAIPRQG